MTIHNKTRNRDLATSVVVADTAATRMRGLLNRDSLNPQEALLIKPCSSVHMLFMKFAIDVVFINERNFVVGCCQHLKPFAFSPVFWNSCCAIELPAGKIKETGTAKGDEINIWA